MGKPTGDAMGYDAPAAATASPGTPRPSTRSTIRSPRWRSPPWPLVTREPLGVVAAIVPWNFPCDGLLEVGSGARHRQPR